VTETTDEKMTAFGTPVGTRRRPLRRSAPSLTDPRRAPDGFAEPSARSSESAVTADDSTARYAASTGVAAGVATIRDALRSMPASPGVYRMLDRRGDALYVGKARSLKSRVQNYAHPAGLSNRLRRMIAETAAIEIVVTHTEAEALLLECNLIKRLMPRYNVLLRDDKSFPFIHLTAGHDFPQLTKFRGARTKEGSYFGPFASAGSVNRTLVTLQKAFLLRSCSDSVFATRTRPCLLYQIKRCSAPCVGYIAREDYAALIEQAHTFLSAGAMMFSNASQPRWKRPRTRWISRRRPWFVTESARCRWFKGTKTSTSRASSMPTSSPPIRRAGRPASRFSSSAAGRIGAIGRISQATTGSCRLRRC
jgi:hypothetical protein